MAHGTIAKLTRVSWLGADAPSERGAAPWRAYAWALGAVVLCTLIDQGLRGRMAEANLILVYLLGILAVALRGDPGGAVAAAVLSVGAFDFFFVHPFLTFAVSDTQYLLTFAIMGLVGGVTSTLTSRLVAQLSAARHRERRVRALYELSRSLLSAREPAAIMAEGARVIGVELGQPVGAWLKGADGEPQAASPTELAPHEREALRWTMRERHPAGPGMGAWPDSRYLFLPVIGAKRLHGALALGWVHLEVAHEGDVRATLATSVNQLAIALDEAAARDEAEQARRQVETERLRSTLLSSVSHDLRTPLTGIVGAASTLVDGAERLTPEVRRELAQGIVEESNRLGRLVTNLLSATRLETGLVQPARTWFALEEVIGPVLARLATELERHPVHVELPPDLPLVHADPILVEQVFVNLLENAARYTPVDTPVRVRAWPEPERLWVEVSDRGPGLPPGEEERVFEKFRRYSAGDGGAGLGLAIARGVVQAHGGTMTARNLPEGGAAFRFSLPLAAAPARSVEDAR